MGFFSQAFMAVAQAALQTLEQQQATGAAAATPNSAGSDGLPHVISVNPVPVSLATLRTTAPANDRSAIHAGSLDATFGRVGAVVLSAANGVARALAVRADGGCVVAGQSSNDSGRPSITVARYADDGQLDASFGGSGCVRLDVAYAADALNDSAATAVAVQADGSIVIAGTAHQPPSAFSFEDLVLARLTRDGRLDPSFSTGGWLRLPFGMASGANALLIEPDGRIVAAGYLRHPQTGRFHIFLLRVTTDGQPDASFGEGGFVMLPASADEQAVCIARDEHDGKIVGVASQSARFDKKFGFFRLAPNGHLDTTFGNEGRVSLDLGGGDNVVSAIAVQPDGKYVATGYLETRQYALLRLESTGSLDATFGDGGFVTGRFGSGNGTGSSGNSFGQAVAVDTSGAIYVGGAVTEASNSIGYAGGMSVIDSDRACALARFLTNGEPDTSFGANGVVLADLGQGADEIHALALAGDAVVAAGQSGRGMALLRVHASTQSSVEDAVVTDAPRSAAVGEMPGERPARRRWLDPTFAGGGAAFGVFAPAPAVGRAMAVQPDGSIVVAGSVGTTKDEGGRNIGVVRFDRDGRLDKGFGRGGYKLLDLEGTDAVARGVAVQPDGRIVVAGDVFDGKRGVADFALLRLHADGQLDSAFQGGVVITDFDRGTDDGASAVALQTDGKVVAAGYTISQANLIVNGTDFSDIEFFALMRYHADGTLDTQFGINGRVRTLMALEPGGRARIAAIHIADDGGILAAGFARENVGARTSRLAIARYLPDGTEDAASFGRYGSVKLEAIDGMDEAAYALAVQPDGKIIVAGEGVTEIGGDPHFLVVRLNANGTPDGSFNGTGKAVLPDLVGMARAVVVLPDGRIIAAGDVTVREAASNGGSVTRDRIALVCYEADGSLDVNFGTDGVLTIDVGGDSDRAYAALQTGDGKVLVAGATTSGNASDFVVARVAVSGDEHA